MREGLQETLTLHRLGVADKLRKSLAYTNIVENLNGSMKAHLGKIRRWTDSKHCHRWIAVAATECEPKFKKIKNADHLPKLQQALLKQVHQHELMSTSNQL